MLIGDKDEWLTKQLYLDKSYFFRVCLNLELEKSHQQLQTPIEGFPPLEIDSPVEEKRRHRFSALINGICIGVGMVFILMGVLMPITSSGMLVQGLMSIIGGLVVLTVGTVVEVYHWAQLS
ncbi:MAG: hypothetical protein JSW72_04725 [Candidatus Bathyarchaeota archaeon]|nr:MAG: hypothetical protein JSW72_04725 [Candidatus Bathyarchaeota archaeon]